MSVILLHLCFSWMTLNHGKKLICAKLPAWVCFCMIY